MWSNTIKKEKKMTGYHFSAFILIILLSFTAIASDNQLELEARIVKLEKLIHSDPFIYDIELRRKIERSLVQQEEFTRRIPEIEKKLSKLKDQFDNRQHTPFSDDIDKKIDDKVSDLEAEFSMLLEATTTLHKESLSTMNIASNKTFQSASTAANQANKRFDQYLVVQSVILAIVGIVISVIAWFIHKKINHIDRTSDRSKKHLNNARTIYIKHKNEIADEKESLIILKREILSLHKMLDVRENYSTLQIKGFNEKPFLIKVKQQALSLLTELLDIKKLPGNGYEKELKANISYCSAILGIMSFREGEFYDAHEYFVQAEVTNVHDHIDRVYNLACAASKIFQKTNKLKAEYLVEVVDCYIKLSSHIGQTRKLMKDPDIVAIENDIKQGLRQRGVAILITP